MPHRAGGIGGHDRLRAEVADEPAALRKGLDVALDNLDALESRTPHREQLMVYRLEVLADDVQTRLRQQVMDVRDPAAQGVLERDHRKRCLAVFRGREGVLEARVGHGLHRRVRLLAGEVAVRSRLPLESDSSSIRHQRRHARNFERRSVSDAVCTG